MSLLAWMEKQRQGITEGCISDAKQIQQLPDKPTSGVVEQRPPVKKSGLRTMYVATNLDFWETDTPHWYAKVVIVNGVKYFRLDPMLYAWFRHKMTKVFKAADAGDIQVKAFENILHRYALFENRAHSIMNIEKLLLAVKYFNPQEYSPLANEHK
jgi:hypothetical protein